MLTLGRRSKISNLSFHLKKLQENRVEIYKIGNKNSRENQWNLKFIL